MSRSLQNRNRGGGIRCRTVCAKAHLVKCLVCLGNSKRAGVAGVWLVWDVMVPAQATGMEKTYELIVPFLHLFLLYLRAKVSMVFSSMAGPGKWI